MKGIEFAQQVANLNNYYYSNTLVMLTADDIDVSLKEARQAGYTEVLPNDNFESL